MLARIEDDTVTVKLEALYLAAEWIKVAHGNKAPQLQVIGDLLTPDREQRGFDLDSNKDVRVFAWWTLKNNGNDLSGPISCDTLEDVRYQFERATRRLLTRAMRQTGPAKFIPAYQQYSRAAMDYQTFKASILAARS